MQVGLSVECAVEFTVVRTHIGGCTGLSKTMHARSEEQSAFLGSNRKHWGPGLIGSETTRGRPAAAALLGRFGQNKSGGSPRKTTHSHCE
jgi:hypothetical protein